MAEPPLFRDGAWEQPCNGGNCVEVAFQDGWVGIRDGKVRAAGPVLTFTGEEWAAFMEAVKAGRLDPP